MGKILSAEEAEKLPNGSRIKGTPPVEPFIMTKKSGLWHTSIDNLAWGCGKLLRCFTYETI